MIDAYASLPHYADHLAPIWERLRAAGAAGEWWAAKAGCWWGSRAPRRWQALSARPVLVASLVDAVKSAPRPYVYVEHGAGQTYPGDPLIAGHGSYSGGAGHDRAVLFLCPHETVAARWRAAYPAAPAMVVGSPKLDPWHRKCVEGTDIIGTDHTPTVSVSFHWACQRIPETDSALGHYQRHLPRLVAEMRALGWRVLGHGHPRDWPNLRRHWEAAGAEPVERFSDILDRADVLAVDNSSAGPEFASTGRPIVWLNAPGYRRTVHHGGRFWEWTQGIPTVDGPDELIGGLSEAMEDRPSARLARERMLMQVYAHRDGRAAERATEAVLAVIRGRAGHAA